MLLLFQSYIFVRQPKETIVELNGVEEKELNSNFCQPDELESKGRRWREKDLQFLPDPKRPWRTKAV